MSFPDIRNLFKDPDPAASFPLKKAVRAVPLPVPEPPTVRSVETLPPEFADFPLLIEAIIETEGVFEAGTQQPLYAGTSYVDMTPREVEVDVCENGVPTKRRVRTRPPYTTYAERIAEVKKIHATSTSERTLCNHERKILDHYLACIMRGNILIGA